MENQPSDGIRTHIVADALRRRMPIVIAVAIILTGVVSVFLYHRAPKYTAEASVQLRPITGNALSPDSATNGQQVTIAMQTEAGLVSSPGVARLASRRLNRAIAADSVKATVPANSEIVQIGFSADTARAAQQGAQAFAVSFLDYRRSQSTATNAVQVNSLRKQLTAAAASLKTASAAAAKLHASAEAAAQVQLYANRVATLQDSIGQLEATDSNPGTVVKPAALPGAPAGINRIVVISGVAVVGLLLGLGLAVWLEFGDNRVRGSETAIAGVPVLCSTPRERRPGPALISQRESDDAMHNAYRRARTGIVAMTKRPTVLVVAPMSAFEPSAEVAANLALSLSSAGFRTCLVDATLNDAGLAHLFGIKKSPGLSDIVSIGDVDATAATIDLDALRILPAGRDPMATRELYTGDLFKAILAQLRDTSDYVIVAGPPLDISGSDSVALLGDSLALVLREKRTTHGQVADLMDRFETLGINVLGAISLPRARNRAADGLAEDRARLASSRKTDNTHARDADSEFDDRNTDGSFQRAAASPASDRS